MSAFNNVKISAKTFTGFGLMIALLLVISAVAYVSLGDSAASFTHYRGLARQTAVTGRVQAHLLETRINAKNFVINANENNIKEVKERAAKTLERIADFRNLVAEDPAKTAIADKARAAIEEYVAAFDVVTQKQHHREELVDKALSVIGPEMEKKLTQIMEASFHQGNAEGAFRAGETLRGVLLMRLYVVKYLNDNEEADYQRVDKEASALDEKHRTLMNVLSDPDSRRLAEEVAALDERYNKAFNEVHGLIVARNDVIKHTLDRIGPEVATLVEEFEVEVKKEQDALGPQAVAAMESAKTVTLMVSALSVLFGMLAAWLIGNGISRPITGMTSAMGELASGNKTIDIPGVGRGDEIGRMASAVQVFKDNMIKAERLAEEQRQEEEARALRAKSIENLTRKFDNEVTGVLTHVSSSAHELEVTSTSMSSAAEQATRQSTAVAAAAEQASANVQTVASAAEELASSIAEIGRQVNQSTRVSEKAVRVVNSTDKKVQGLSEAAQRIGEVVALITDIADQTNLLALNATIEAARAGDAGKGFAVVASEVKNLASQTGKATEEIRSQIVNVQAATQEAVQAIREIGQVIGEMNEIATAIASAVEEQQAATSEIARNVEQAAKGTEEVTSNISGVSNAAQDTGAASNQVLHSAEELSHEADELKHKVEDFIHDVKAA